MALLGSYADDPATTDNDRFLTYASDGSTKLTPASNIPKYIGDGWVLSGDSWSYSSYNSTIQVGVINANSGANTKYGVGMWVKFTQPTLGVKYGKVTAATTTTITVRFTSGTILSNEAITAPYFSAAAQPFGPSNTSSTDAQALYNPYKFSAYQTTSSTLTANTWTKATLSAENFDTSSNFDSSTNYRLVAPVSGFYQINGQVAITSAGATSGVAMQGALYKNGTAIVYSSPLAANGTANNRNYGTVSRLVQLAANDYVELFGFCAETRQIDGDAAGTLTFLTGFLVSAT